MPDINVQDEQGVTHVFPNEATPEMIAKAMGVKPPSGTPQASVSTEKEAAAAPPVPAPPLRAEMMNRGEEERTAQENMAPRARADILGHQVMSKSIAPVTNAMQALYPGAAIGAHYGAKALPYAWHSPYAAPVGAVAGAVIGHGVGSAAKGISDLAAGATYEPPEKISLGPLGKINRNVPPNPYEEMGASAQYRDVARDAMKPPAPTAPTVDPVAQAVKARTANWIPTKVTPPGEAPLPMPMQAHAEMEADIAAGRQGRAGARQEMYGDLAQARSIRTGNPETEGQQYPGIGAPEPNAGEFYGQQGAILAKRPDELTQAVREGRAARLPTRIPKPGEPPAPSPFTGMQSSSPAATSNLLPPPIAAGEGPLRVATGPIPRFVTPGTKTPIPEPPSRFAGMSSTRPSDVAALPQPEYPAAATPATGPKVSYVSKFAAPESTATGVESGDLKTAADNLGRTGSAGDLAHWREDDLWQGYLKNKGTPLGEALGNEIKRRGFAASAAENVRPIPKGKP